jgi:hypothetical protein
VNHFHLGMNRLHIRDVNDQNDRNAHTPSHHIPHPQALQLATDATRRIEVVDNLGAGHPYGTFRQIFGRIQPAQVDALLHKRFQFPVLGSFP